MTIATFDTYIHKMRNDSFFTDFVFELLNRTGGVRLMKGLYLICDGGYQKWRIMQCGNKLAGDAPDFWYSARLGSVRKDIECFFGTLTYNFFFS